MEWIQFWISKDISVEFIEKELYAVFTHLSDLKTICIPYLTTSLLTSLLKLKKLRNVLESWYTDEGCSGKDFRGDPSASPLQLTSFEMPASFQDMIQILDRLPNLTRLCILTRWVETAGMFHALVGALSSSCPRLVDFEVDGIPHTWSFDLVTDELKLACAITRPSLSTFSTFKRLRTLRISSPFPLNIAEDDLSLFLTGLPELESLNLNCGHVVLEDDAFYAYRVETLARLAEWCPRLHILSIYLDCRSLPFHSARPQHTLNLTKLNLGVSHVGTNAIQLAHYFTYHCAPCCVFEEGSSLWADLIKQKVINKYGDSYYSQRWDGERVHLMDMFRMLMQLRSIHEREKVNIMKERDAAIQREKELRLLLQQGRDV